MRVLIFVVASATVCAAAQAAPPVIAPAQPQRPALPDPNTLKLDSDIQGVKDEVLKFDKDAQSVEQDALYPDYSRVTVFVGMRIDDLLLNQISVSFDNGAPQKIIFDRNESIALLLNRKNLVRVLRANLKPGSHRVHAEFSARYADAKPADAPLTGSYDALFDKGYGPADLELNVTRYSRISKPALSLRQWGN
ncbi:MAG: hypothetical protein ACRESS_05020 [Stenotrophobium sp.]